MLARVLKIAAATSLVAANAVIASHAKAQEGYGNTRCVWIQTATGGCAQTCEAWLFTNCGYMEECGGTCLE